MNRAARPLPSRLTPSRRLLVNTVVGGLWVSGVLWLVFHYFLTVKSDFGPSPGPLEPWWLKLHGAFAFAALWTFGLLWGAHIIGGWSSKRRRWSGSFLFGALVTLIVSGYLLYYVGSDEARPWISLAHWAIGLGVPFLYFAHRLIASQSRSRHKAGSSVLPPLARSEYAAGRSNSPPQSGRPEGLKRVETRHCAAVPEADRLGMAYGRKRNLAE